MNWFLYIQPQPLTVINDYSGGNNVIYVGLAVPGTAQSAPGWRIILNTYDGSNKLTNVQCSPHAASFGDVWNNRAGLSYS